MAGEVAAKRHAQAVFEIALEKNDLAKWRSDLDLMAAVFGDATLLPVLDNPRIRFEDKASAVTKNLSGVGELAMNLAKLLIMKRRVKLMPQIAREYGLRVDRHQGIEHAEVTTAVELDTGMEIKLKEQLAEVTGSQIFLEKKVNPEIIGGFVARVGDKVIDGSVRNRLQVLKNNIAQTI